MSLVLSTPKLNFFFFFLIIILKMVSCGVGTKLYKVNGVLHLKMVYDSCQISYWLL